jgi:hypothetical protein
MSERHFPPPWTVEKGKSDPYEPDRWWFAPLLYAGAALVIAAFILV